jgi:hypothetical protein
MTTEPPAFAVPPIEPTPVVSAVPVTPPPPVPPMPPAPPIVDPYAQAAPLPPTYAQAGYQPVYQAGYYGAPQPPKGLSIASMILGIVGAFFSLFYGFGLFPAIAAVITGHIARRRQPHAKGFWLAGLITGYVGLGISLLWIIGIIIFIAYFASHPGIDSGNYGLNN